MDYSKDSYDHYNKKLKYRRPSQKMSKSWHRVKQFVHGSRRTDIRNIMSSCERKDNFLELSPHGLPVSIKTVGGYETSSTRWKYYDRLN
jgi:protoheme ferro-lyase